MDSAVSVDRRTRSFPEDFIYYNSHIMEAECYFHWKYNCSDKYKKLINIKAKRIENIIKSSKLYEDDRHNRLQLQYDENKELILKAHKGCVEKYLHPKEIQKALKRRHPEEKSSLVNEPPRKRRSEVTRFNFLHDCMFCGAECKVEKDKKKSFTLETSLHLQTSKKKRKQASAEERNFRKM